MMLMVGVAVFVPSYVLLRAVKLTLRALVLMAAEVNMFVGKL